LEFLDVLYLGVFIILSPAFDRRFYDRKNLSSFLAEEYRHATGHFFCILHKFSKCFTILLEGEAVAHSYVLDRMLAEFAAASVNLAKAIGRSNEAVDVSADEAGKVEFRPSPSSTVACIEEILQESHPRAFPYYSRCLSGFHKDFTWTGPQIQILARSEGAVSAISFASLGEMLDLPHHQIYQIDVDALTTAAAPAGLPSLGKRRERADSADSVPLAEELRKKQKLKP
jgi:hypothetical protein